MSQEPTIQSTKLKGHQKAVLCLDHSSSLHHGEASTDSSCVVAGSLLSGSEDGTARLWDLRGNPIRASLCICAPETAGGTGEILSVAFAPPWGNSPVRTDGEEPSSSRFARDYSVYLATGNTVYGYDLRNTASPVLNEPSVDLSFMGCEDEVNLIAFAPHHHSLTAARRGRGGRSSHHETTTRQPLLAAGDDAGTVRVTDHVQYNATGSATPKLRIYPHNVEGNPIAMVTSVAFRPRVAKGVELVSGGTDCRICLWDASKDKPRPLSSLTMTCTESGANQYAGASQVFNPPMVNHLHWSPSGRLLAAALGDGSIGLLQAESRSLVVISRLEDAHSGAVASVIFPEWGSSTFTASATTTTGTLAVSSYDRLLRSAGNDGAVVLWDLGASLCGEKAMAPGQRLGLSVLGSVQASMDGLLLTDQPRALFGWEHCFKPNWMVSSRGRDPMFPSALFIADTTNDITVYNIPTT